MITEFNCPSCNHLHTEDDYLAKLDKSPKTYIYMKCKGCKSVLGVTTMINSDIAVWMKKEEPKDKTQFITK